MNASARMLELITGAWQTQVVHAFAALSIAEALDEAPLPAEALAARLMVDPATLARLLRAGVALGLVTRDARQRYAGTALLDTLRDEHGSLRAYAMAVAMPGHWLPWGNAVEAIRSGHRQARATLGQELWDHYRDRPEEAAVFAAGMSALTAQVAQDAARLIRTDATRVAVDVGGASGTLVQALMKANPVLEGIVLDLPHVVPTALDEAGRQGLGARFSVVAGDFFEPPPAANLYLLKHILHDWDDHACLRILRNCRERLATGGRVAVLELALPDEGCGADASSFAPLMDLTMLMLTPGRERTLDEYEALFWAAGLSLAQVTPMPATSMLIMEARGT
ncbi:methyltransferase [Burkholderia gladioli]|uniref:methyltransferase n=1 Tax=Burkholderia gladioli TaxID=28095 RepID=UPI004032A7A9